MESLTEQKRICTGRFGCGKEKTESEFTGSDKTCKACRASRVKGIAAGTMHFVRSRAGRRPSMTIHDLRCEPAIILPPSMPGVALQVTSDAILRDPERVSRLLQAKLDMEQATEHAEVLSRTANEQAEALSQQADAIRRAAADQAAILLRDASERLKSAVRDFDGPPQPFFYVRNPLRVYDSKCDWKMGQTVSLPMRQSGYQVGDPQSAYAIYVPCLDRFQCENITRECFKHYLVKNTRDHFAGMPMLMYSRFVDWLKALDEPLSPRSFSAWVSMTMTIGNRA
jgi:hypothetical protein